MLDVIFKNEILVGLQDYRISKVEMHSSLCTQGSPVTSKVPAATQPLYLPTTHSSNSSLLSLSSHSVLKSVLLPFPTCFSLFIFHIWVKSDSLLSHFLMLFYGRKQTCWSDSLIFLPQCELQMEYKDPGRWRDSESTAESIESWSLIKSAKSISKGETE